MPYRSESKAVPLIVSTDRAIQAFDPATGEPLWEREVASVGGWARIATSGDVVVLAAAKQATFLDVASGRVIAQTPLWFDVLAIVCEGNTIVLGGTNGLACFARGIYAWGIRARETGGLLDRETEFWLEDSKGKRVKKLDRFVPAGASRSDFGMILGSTVFQPDHNT